ncbi:MAG: Ig-like domain-containing protein, partial [Candidatus Omnitrophica bacterium]|nr:Ig-like domain-containing protein [Candidatus Omnitrophota bacterium]
DTDPIYEGDLVQVVTITYNETMDAGVDPVISFAGNVGAITTQGNGAWSVGNTVWTESFDVTDANEETPTVTVTSSAAEDLTGNAEGASTEDTFEIDTLAPAGYTVDINQAEIDIGNEAAMSFTFTDAVLLTTYNYSVDDTNGTTPAVTGNGAIGGTGDTISAIDVSSLDDGVLTLTVYLTDAIGNQGLDTTDTVVKATEIDPDLSTVSAVPLSLAVGGATSMITITLRDANTNPVDGKEVSLSSNRGATDTFDISGTTNSSGVITGTITSTTAGVATVTAVGDPGDTNVTIMQTVDITFVPGPIDANVSTVSVLPVSVPADGFSMSIITVTVYDQYSNPISGKAVSATSHRGGVDVINIGNMTNSSGVVIGTISSTVVGTATITVIADPPGENVTITQTADVLFTEVEINIYDVQIDPIYDAANDAILITTVLLENGTIVTDLGNMTLTYIGVMDKAGVSLSGNLNGSETVIDTINAIYHTTWDPAAGLTANTVYTIIVRITYDGDIYSGVKAFSVNELGDLLADVAGIESKIDTIQTTVTRVDVKMDTVEDKIDAHEDSQAIYRDTTVDTLTLLTGEIGAILEDTSTTLTDLISTQVATELAKGIQAEIITRSTTVETGSTVSIRFRTFTGLVPVLTVYDPRNITRISNSVMSEIGTTGIYARDVTFSTTWGLGDFTVLIQEPVNESIDSVMMNVVQSLATGSGTSSSSISTDLIYSRLTNMDSDITNLVSGMEGVTTATGDVSTDIAQLIDDLNLVRSGPMTAGSIGSIVDAVGVAIGDGEDSEFETILARLAGIDGKLMGIGADTALAASMNQGAMSQSNLIQSIVEHIKGLLEEGDIEGAEEELAKLAEKLLELKDGVDGVPGAVTTDSMAKAMQGSIDELNALAAEKGIEDLIPPIEFPEEGLAAKAEDVIAIRNGVSELKSLMVEVRGLLDQEINKPIVHGWLESEE